MTKANEATAAETRETIIRLLDQALEGYTPGQATGMVKVGRVGRFLIVDIGHFEKLHQSSGMGEGELLLTRQGIKSATITYHDPPEIVAERKRVKKK